MIIFLLHCTAGLWALFCSLFAWGMTRIYIGPLTAIAVFTVVLFGTYFGTLKILL